MARKLDVRGRRTDPAEIARQDGGDPVFSLGYAGNPVNGTASPDFLLAQDANGISGFEGDDFILGDIGPFGTAQNGNGSFATAYNFDFIPHCFSTVENPLFADDSVPHCTVYVQGENQFEYFQITVGAGQTLTIDIDGAGGSLGSAADTNTYVELYAAGDLFNPVAVNDNSFTGAGGYGSESDLGDPGEPGLTDSFLVFTNNGPAGIFYIRIVEPGGGGEFETDDEFLLNLSLTGAATGGTTNEHGDNINGGSGNDHIYGAAGNDVLLGGSGFDFLVGGTGDDRFIIDGSDDFVVELAGEGNDRITLSSGGFSLFEGLSIETIDCLDEFDQDPITLAGNSIANTMSANNGNNKLYGLGGSDTLYGRGGNDLLDGGAGADVMDGGAQNDTYYVDNTGDVVVEHNNANGGADILYVSFSYTLAAGVSIELLTTSAISGTAAIDMTGNELNNTLWGNNGANTLSGGIGGQDTLVGFLGNDIYLINNVTEVVVENAGEGTDIVYVNSNYTLSAHASIELLSTYDIAGTAPLNLTGNNLSNTIWGNRGNNTLSGGVGGNDTLVGFLGDDIYLINNITEVVVEHAGEGTDIVYVNSSYTLSAGASIELLSTYSIAGTQAFNMTGNELSNTIWGNRGNNTLSGGFGGNDTLVGFLGDDNYLVNNGNEVISELASEGTDIVYAGVSYILSAGASVELLSTSSIGGTGSIHLAGNELANTIWGNAGANILNGYAGNDTLLGFGGADTFQFNTALGASNVDQLGDFSVADDTIALDDAIFSGIGTPGAFNANAFRAGAAAADADDRIIYNQATGQLFYDADGNGAGAQILFATLTGNPALTASDFAVI